MFPTIIIRHRKENLKKCSLKGLEKKKNFLFYSYPNEISKLPDLSNYILLKMGAPKIKKSDNNKGLLLIDSTWKYLDKILKIIPDNIATRSLPNSYISAYPRKQTMCPDPKLGLASIEALYLAYIIMGKDVSNLLDNYYWKDKFIKINPLNE